MKNKKFKIIIVLITMLWSCAEARPEEKSVINTLLYSIFIPGGGHFYLDEPGAGNLYLLSEGLLLTGGLDAQKNLAEGEWNFFFVNALKLHETNIFTSYREARLLNDNAGYHTPIDKTPFLGLALAPFTWDNIKDPFVYGFFLAGVGLNVLEASLNADRKNCEQISGVRIMGAELDRDAGTGSYGAMWLTLSFSSAVAEECAYRGVMQVECEESLGKTSGWLLSSGMFGLGHLRDWADARSWADAGIATLAGMYLGWVFQKEDYRLSKPIAAHFWFNAGAGIALFIMDPQNNPLGLKITFDI